VFAIVVVVDSPHKVSPYGGVVAAPIFQKIAAAALRHDGVPQNINAPAPLLVDRRDETTQQTSGPVTRPPIVTLAGAPVFPDLTGMSAREALRVLARLGLSVRLHGAGVVAQQMPAAGTPLDAAVTAVLRLERHPPDEEGGVAKP
jgi:cell division protein FtsI (penicillin-binding protein 3)